MCHAWLLQFLPPLACWFWLPVVRRWSHDRCINGRHGPIQISRAKHNQGMRIWHSAEESLFAIIHFDLGQTHIRTNIYHTLCWTWCKRLLDFPENVSMHQAIILYNKCNQSRQLLGSKTTLIVQIWGMISNVVSLFFTSEVPTNTWHKQRPHIARKF